MAYSIVNPIAGMMPIANTDTGVLSPVETSNGLTTYYPTSPMKAGMIVDANDPTYGQGEFILLLGVASTAVGSVVTYNVTTFQTTLAAPGTNIPQPIAIAMAATGATSWGWYQISGVAVVAKNQATATFVAGGACGVPAGSTGVLGNTATGSEIQGAVIAAGATVSTATVQVLLNRPHMQGRIT
jgi:hypothetical protein